MPDNIVYRSVQWREQRFHRRAATAIRGLLLTAAMAGAPLAASAQPAAQSLPLFTSQNVSGALVQAVGSFSVHPELLANERLLSLAACGSAPAAPRLALFDRTPSDEELDR